MAKILNVCIQCQAPFLVEKKYINAGKGKFCSAKCSSDNRKGTGKLREINNSCAHCGNGVHIPVWRTSKSGLHYCNRDCKQKAQKIGGNYQHPSHYSHESKDYRKLVQDSCGINKCEICGYDKIQAVLQVHHIDGNRSNNSLTNLRVLCPNCHEETHYAEGSGRYTKRKNKRVVPD